MLRDRYAPVDLFALAYRPLFPRSDQFKQGRVHLHGLLLDGERKSIEPLRRRVLSGDEPALKLIVNQSSRDPAPVLTAYRARLAAAFGESNGISIRTPSLLGTVLDRDAFRFVGYYLTLALVASAVYVTIRDNEVRV
jgi:hypothetical protein